MGKSLYGRGFFQIYLQVYFSKKQYYEALNSILEKLYNSYHLYFNVSKIGKIILTILIVLLIGIYLINNCKNCYKKNKEEASNEFCSICSVKFNDNNDKKKEKIKADDLDSVTLRLLNKDENEKIDILKCGHKFHSKCISNIKKSNNNLNNYCPLCNQKK